jgi:hypothetical protein
MVFMLRAMVAIALLLYSTPLAAQHKVAAYKEDDDSLTTKAKLKYAAIVSKRASQAERQFDKRAARHLRKMERLQNKLLRRIAQVDSLAADDLRNSFSDKLVSLSNHTNQKSATGAGSIYLPHADSTSTVLKFLQVPALNNQHLTKAANQFRQAQDKLQQAEHIKSIIRQRLQNIKNLPGLKSLQKQIAKYQKQAWYFNAQISAYKNMLNTPAAIERRALQILNKLPAFKNFMQQHGQLAGLFGLPASPGGAGQVGAAGLQTRTAVQQLLQQQIGTGGTGALQQVRDNVQAAQNQLQQLKTKVRNAGSNSGDMEIPDFKPNNQKAKTFLQRIQLGGNIQFARPNGFVPTTSDVAVTVAYKLNDKSSIGIGGSYKLGLGSWKRIRFTHEGVSLRSFGDLKLKGQLFITAGYELNHFAQFRRIEGISNLDWWQHSGLAGLSRKYKIGKKRGGNFQVLYDFLHKQHSPQSQPLLIRTGFTF